MTVPCFATKDSHHGLLINPNRGRQGIRGQRASNPVEELRRSLDFQPLLKGEDQWRAIRPIISPQQQPLRRNSGAARAAPPAGPDPCFRGPSVSPEERVVRNGRGTNASPWPIGLEA